MGSECGTGLDRLWWLYPPRCMAYLHQYECVSTNQNGMFSILQQNYTMSPSVQDIFQPIPGFINCARRWELLSQATQKGSHSGGWLYPCSRVEASLIQHLSYSCLLIFQTIATTDQSPLSRVVKCSCDVKNVHTAWTIWVCLHQSNRMSLALAAYNTEVATEPVELCLWCSFCRPNSNRSSRN